MRPIGFAALMLAAAFALTIFSPRFLRTVRVDARTTSGSAPRTPVLIELFTSEGCSDCPPADALLEKLDLSQPVPNAQVIVLSEHVTYWDDGGWRDPFSLQDVTTRQGDYASRFRLSGPYTPQMVVDGDSEFVGSDERRALRVVEKAAELQKIQVSLSAIRPEGDSSLTVHVESGTLGSPKPADILLAVADERDQSSVRHGENAGRDLTHVAVVRTLTKIGKLDPGGAFSKDVKVSTANTNHQNLRIIAFIQETGDGRVLGIGAARFPDSAK